MYPRDELKRRAMQYGGAVVVAAAACGVLALSMPRSQAVDLLTGAAIFAIYVMSWAVFCGPALEASFGHSFFIGSVAYATALLHTRAGISPVVCLVVAPLIGGGLGIFVALLTHRHRGLYFSMTTMALQLTLYRCLFLYSPVFGGEEGIFGIRTIAITRVGAFLLAGGAAIGAYLIAQIYVGSRQCLLLSAVGRNERLAEATGVSVVKSRALALVLSGALAAVGGALYVFTIGQASAELGGDRLSSRVVLLGTLSGAQTPFGPFILGTTFYVADQFFSDSFEYTALATAVLLLFLVIVLPRGVVRARPSWTEPCVPLERHETQTGDGLRVDGLGRSFGGIRALNAVTFALTPGTVTGIIGPNGAGKTTLLRALAGDIETDSGRILWRNRPLRGGASTRARLGIRKTFQNVESFGELTVREHLAVSMTVHGTTMGTPGLREVLEDTGLLNQLDVAVNQLSPAMARLIDLAMAIAAHPKVVLLDEPFAGISTAEGAAVSKAIRRLQQSGASVVVVEHRLQELFPLVERVLVMCNGMVVADEPPHSVFTNPFVLEAYGTRAMAMQA
jgi:ABC-type branched-subunit amino acid transport system ATPase component/ABC-type branched-subunit amino acid transport system permease subunit